MPVYEVEQYELHSIRYRVTADTAAQAIADVMYGKAEPIDDSLEYIEVPEDYGMPAREIDPESAWSELRKQIRAANLDCDEDDGDLVASIRSITKLEGA